MIPTASSNLTSSVTTPMKYVVLLIAAALLWASHASAQIVQLNSLTDTTTGIAYRVKTREVSASTLLTSTDHTILANATSGAITLSLPAAGTNTATRVYVVQKTDSSTNAVTIDGSGSETIDGTTTIKLTQPNQTVIIQAGFSAWHIVGPRPANSYTQAATATLTADQLYGSTIVNTGASGAVVYTLPAPQLGMRFRVYLTAAQDVDINPADSTQILALTNATGDAISSASTIGNCIELVALSSTTWGAFFTSGTWTDVN